MNVRQYTVEAYRFFFLCRKKNEDNNKNEVQYRTSYLLTQKQYPIEEKNCHGLFLFITSCEYVQ